MLNGRLVIMWQDYWFICNSHTDRVSNTTDNLCIDSIDSQFASKDKMVIIFPIILMYVPEMCDL